MKPRYYNFQCPCKLLHDMESSTDLFAFLNENVPIPVVLDNLHEASKNTLECTCCIFGNALWRLSQNPSRWKRIKTKCSSFISRWLRL